MNNTIALATFLSDIEQQLLTVYDDPVLCRQYAWWIAQAILKINKAELITQGTVSPSSDQRNALAQWLEKLIVYKMPIQYLIGTVPFCGAEILVEAPVLIPRPETEEWCGNLIEQLKQLQDQRITILDLCCGSGCIAVALAKALPAAILYAVDISADAIALTENNVAHNSVKNVIVMQSDLFAGISPSVRFDMIVTNPPYIADKEWPTLDKSVRDWEDKKALCARDDGMDIIKRIIDQASLYLIQNKGEFDKKNIPQLVIEIGYSQGPAVCALMRHAQYAHVTIKKDLEGKDRVVVGFLY